MLRNYTPLAILALFLLFLAIPDHLFSSEMKDCKGSGQMMLYDIGFYQFNLEVSNNNREISGWAEIHASALDDQIDTITLQLSNSMTVDSVFVDNVDTYYYHADHLLKIPSSIIPDQEFIVKVYYHGTPSGTFFTGIHRQYSSEYDRWVTWTFSQPFYAYKWFPCKQMHEDKIDSVYMNLITDSTLTAVSSGILNTRTQIGNAKVRHEWRTKYAISYDMIFFAVSDYIFYDYYVHPEGIPDSIHITHYVYNQDYLDDYIDRLDSIGLFVEYFSDIYGIYPFADECFGLVVVPGFPSMVENNTLVTMIDELDFGYTHTFIDGNCHEITHQWFGDYVACHTFADIWLSEGFGMYGGYLGEEQFGLPGSAEAWLEKTRSEAFLPKCGSVCVPEDQLTDASRIFSWRITYCKGSLLLHMIRYTLQDDSMFFSVLQNYIEEFGNGTSVLDDFKSILEEVSGQDFTTFFDQWYYGEGYPILDISWEQYGDTLQIYSTESTSCDTTPFFNLTMDYQIVFNNGDTIVRLVQDNPFEHYKLHTEKQVVDVIPDPEHWIMAETNTGHVGVKEEFGKTDILMYPNPCNGVLIVKLREPVQDCNIITVYNTSGRLIMQKTFHQETTMKLQGFPAGVYFVSVQDEYNKTFRKIILL
jgi:aminopeptidase N